MFGPKQTAFLFDFVPLGVIIRNRDKYPIFNRSPRLIIIGAIYSICNTLIVSIQNGQLQCYLSIFSTLIFANCAYLCVFLRAYRLYKVFFYYEQFWERLRSGSVDSYDHANQNSLTKEEQNRLQKTRVYREDRLIYHLFLNMILPLMILALLSIFSPYVYVINPVFQTGTCWRHFITSGQLESDTVPCNMIRLNLISFIVINWICVVGYVIIYWKIKNIRNELNIKKEIAIIMVSWVIFSMIYFLLNLILQSYLQDDDSMKEITLLFNQIIFFIIIFRNFFILCAQTLFSIYMLLMHPERTYPKLLESKLFALDFDMVLNSLQPFENFYDFLENYSPHHCVYIEVYTLIRLYDQGLNELKEHENHTKLLAKKTQEIINIQKNIIDIINANYYTHFSERKERNNSLQNKEELIYMAETQEDDMQFDINNLLSTFKIENTSSVMLQSVQWSDFSQFKEKCIEKLKEVYEEKYKNHPAFNELIINLYKNEVEYKFLEQAKVIK